MSFKEYIKEQQEILDEHEERLDEILKRKRRIDSTKGGSPMVKWVWVDTDPNYKVVHHSDGSVERRRISQTERNNRSKKKGQKGNTTVSRKRQAKSLQAHYDRIGGPERTNNGQGTGDVVFKRLKKQKVRSDEKAAEKLKKKSKIKQGLKKLAGLTGGPKKIWDK